MRQATHLLVMLPLVLGLVSCAVLGVEGSGNVTTESGEVGDFDEIVLRGTGRVMIQVSGNESLTIEAEDNILPLLETEVSDGRLLLGTRSNISPSVEIVYTITAASLNGIEVSGSGEVVATGVDGTDFRTDISGSGRVETAGVVSNLFSLSISGSGDFNGEEMLAASGQVDVSGSGDAVVNVSDALDVSVSGSGNVEYLGSPTLDVTESGSGNVTRGG